MWMSAASLAGLLAALDVRPSWGYEHARRTAELCRTRLAEAGVDVVVPGERATLVSWRVVDERPADVVARLAERGVIVRDLPRTDLVRASVGWWTSEDDLRRLVDGAVA
jgi:L-cysteine/cystine lyase